jgi:hypothetical protein
MPVPEPGPGELRSTDREPFAPSTANPNHTRRNTSSGDVMKFKGPIATLAVGVAVGAGLLIANVVSAPGTSNVASTATSSGAAATTGAAASTAAPAAGASDAAATVAVTATAPAASAAVAPSAAAATTTAAPAVATYAGRVNGGGPLAVSVKGRTAVAYLCDGRTEAWLWGTADGNKVALHDKKGGTLTGTRGGGRMTGELTAGGGHWTFSLPSVSKPSGLYRSTANVRGARVVSGWVVLPDGKQVGMSSSTATGETQAPALDLLSGRVVIQGESQTASLLDPDAGPA